MKEFFAKFFTALLSLGSKEKESPKSTKTTIKPINTDKSSNSGKSVNPVDLKDDRLKEFHNSLKDFHNLLTKYSGKYDYYFFKYAKEFFGPEFTDYSWFKAQAIAESNLKPKAVSPAGACGIMQIMPATFKDIAKKIDVQNVFDPEQNIKAGIFYDKYLFDEWYAKRPFNHRMAFMYASYNAGLSNILKAQKRCTISPNYWTSVREWGHLVTTWKHTETIEYVDRIFNILQRTL